MMNLRKFTFILSLLITAGLSAFSQSDTISLKTIVAKTAKLNTEHPVEKVYLHFDKPYYAVGDTIWFKAYVTIDLHSPSNLSKIVYVDIISSKDSIVQSLKLPVTGSIAFGNIALTKDLFRQGSYHFRAYTNWMRNSDPDYFFNKTIAIGDAIDKDVFTDVSLSGSAKGNSAKVDARIHYKDVNGHSYSGKKVTWKVQDGDDETIGKGKATTDNNGNININFSTNKTGNLKSSVLLAAVDITDQKTVNSTFSLKHATAPMDVQFFPEGGELINGVKTKVAFKAIQPNGLGIAVKGSITDNSGAVVADLTTQHLGMGVFDLLPASGKTYKANITFPDGSKNTYDLPQVKPDGIALSVVNTDPEKIGIRLSASDLFFQNNKGKLLYIVAQNGQVICFAAQTPLTSQLYTAAVPKSKFPTGVLKLTLFAANDVALAERVIFIQRNDQLNIAMSTPKPTYAPRQKVTLNISAKEAAQPSEANLSITVIDESKVPFDENSETTILTNLLLTSDLKGYVEKPNYYFNHANDKTAADLDILMLTQGYSRFSYKDIIANKYPVNKFLPEDGITITGTLRTSTGMPLSKGNVNFTIKDRHTSINTITNPVGEFKFSKLFFPDSVQATINAKGNYNSNNLMILLDNDPFQAPTPNISAPDEAINIDSTLNNYLKNSKQQFANSHVLKEVVIKAATPVKKPSHLDYPGLIGLDPNPDQTIPGDRLTGCSSLFECLKVATLGLVYYDNNLYVRRAYDQGNRQPVQVYFNEMAVDYGYLNSIVPTDVESVEVFLNDGLSGINKTSGTNGVIVINSKKVVTPKMTKEQIRAFLEPQNSAVNFTPKGYTFGRIFYSPKYDVSATTGIGGDLRTTIYWNPKVLTNKTGNATVDFFNADGRGTYRAIIEGIDNNGNIGRAVYRYKVE